MRAEFFQPFVGGSCQVLRVATRYGGIELNLALAESVKSRAHAA